VSHLTRLGRTLVISLPSDLTDQEGQALLSGAGVALADRDADRLILDARGLRSADSFLAQILRDLGLLSALFGAKPVLVGLPAGVALVLSLLEIDLSHLGCARTMDEALRG
jgi:rsbT antagonist protein RsbS